MDKPTKGLRFAPIIRVSTEDALKRGESLNTQTKQIKQYVEVLMEGTIPDHCWQYCGQEHATVNQERAKLDQLLADSGKNLFDAVIVVHPDRWARDNFKSKEGLITLRENGIKFYVGTREYNLFTASDRFFLGMSVELGEYFALLQLERSILNRIERAKRGVPTAGKIPYGRRFNKATEKWEPKNPEEEAEMKAEGAKIKAAAKRYLAGESLVTIAPTVGMKVCQLWNVLNRLAGDKWPLRFRAKELNIDETVELTIPRLLDDDVIAAIHRQAEANKTYHHGQNKRDYLLSRMIFCGKCGYTLTGHADPTGHFLYYRHQRGRTKPCSMDRKNKLPFWSSAHPRMCSFLPPIWGIMSTWRRGLRTLAQLQAVNFTRLRIADQNDVVDSALLHNSGHTSGSTAHDVPAHEK